MWEHEQDTQDIQSNPEERNITKRITVWKMSQIQCMVFKKCR